MSDSDSEGLEFIIEQRDQIKVFAGQQGHVVIEQRNEPEPSIVIIHPDDVPLLIKHLENARVDAIEIRKMDDNEQA